MENSTEDSPLGKNPFAKDDPRFEDWRTALRAAKEEMARFNADHLKTLPLESEHSEIRTEWLVQGVVGRFDVQAKWFCIFYVFSYETADHYERGLKVLIEATLAIARQTSPGGIREEHFLSELKIRLSQRLHHWKAEALQFAREAEQARKEQRQPDGGSADPALTSRTTNGADSKPELTARAVGWEDIEITFLSEDRVQIDNGASIETLNYAEFGFLDRRTEKPTKAWETLQGLAGLKGVIPSGLDGPKFVRQRQGPYGIVQFSEVRGGRWKIVEKRVQEIRKAFRAHFKITTGDPIPFVEGTGYKARFKISRGPSVDT